MSPTSAPPLSGPAKPTDRRKAGKHLLAWAGACFAMGIAIQIFLAPRGTEIPDNSPGKGSPLESKLSTIPVVLKGIAFDAEMAITVQEQMQGLMGREHLGEDEAMLFVGTTQGPRTFWMKNTLIPLDILFFDQHWKLVGRHENVPPCEADPCPRYHSPSTSMHVLEIGAGRAQEIGIVKGDALSFPEGQPWLQ